MEAAAEKARASGNTPDAPNEAPLDSELLAAAQAALREDKKLERQARATKQAHARLAELYAERGIRLEEVEGE